MANKKKKITNEEKSKLKNYVILFVIFGCCIALTLYFCKGYEVYKEYQKEIPVIRDYLMEITKDDLEHFTVENTDVVLYMCTASDDQCRLFEKDLKKYIRKNEITDEIVYLNLSGVELDTFIDEFNNHYCDKYLLRNSFPSFVVFKDGEVVSILQGSKNKKISISKVQSFLDLYLNQEEELDEAESLDE